jgi:hypothetical protein
MGIYFHESDAADQSRITGRSNNPPKRNQPPRTHFKIIFRHKNA